MKNEGFISQLLCMLMCVCGSLTVLALSHWCEPVWEGQEQLHLSLSNKLLQLGMGKNILLLTRKQIGLFKCFHLTLKRASREFSSCTVGLSKKPL